MASNALEQVPQLVPADDFQTLEEKIYRTIEMYRAAKQGQAAAERDAQRLRQQLEEREEQLVALKREAVQLRKEREEIRGRVEKMLEQIESVAVDLAHQIRHQYTIAYAPINQALDGSYRSIRLTVAGPDHYKVRTRPGYRAVPEAR